MQPVQLPTGKGVPTVPPAPTRVITSNPAPWRRRPGAWLRLCSSHSAFGGGASALVAQPWHAATRLQAARYRRCHCHAAAEQMQVAITGASSVEHRATTRLRELTGHVRIMQLIMAKQAHTKHCLFAPPSTGLSWKAKPSSACCSRRGRLDFSSPRYVTDCGLASIVARCW